MRKPTAADWLRGLIFNVWMGGSALVVGTLCLPVLLVAPNLALSAVRVWCRAALRALELICGIRVELRGLHHLPRTGVLIAGKHQSMLDTVAPFALSWDNSDRNSGSKLSSPAPDSVSFGSLARTIEGRSEVSAARSPREASTPPAPVGTVRT